MRVVLALCGLVLSSVIMALGYIEMVQLNYLKSLGLLFVGTIGFGVAWTFKR